MFMMEHCIYSALSRSGEFLSSVCNISFQWNTDGVPLFRSSSYSMWPMYFKINKLPQRMRNGLNNKILAGVWFGTTKPSVNTFLKTAMSGNERNICRRCAGSST